MINSLLNTFRPTVRAAAGAPAAAPAAKAVGLGNDQLKLAPKRNTTIPASLTHAANFASEDVKRWTSWLGQVQTKLANATPEDVGPMQAIVAEHRYSLNQATAVSRQVARVQDYLKQHGIPANQADRQQAVEDFSKAAIETLQSPPERMASAQIKLDLAEYKLRGGVPSPKLEDARRYTAGLQDDWTSRVADQLRNVTEAPPERQGIELEKLAAMNVSRTNANQLANLLAGAQHDLLVNGGLPKDPAARQAYAAMITQAKVATECPPERFASEFEKLSQLRAAAFGKPQDAGMNAALMNLARAKDGLVDTYSQDLRKATETPFEQQYPVLTGAQAERGNLATFSKAQGVAHAIANKLATTGAAKPTGLDAALAGLAADPGNAQKYLDQLVTIQHAL